MIEIVFGDSACGSLKAAQHHGVGKYGSGCVGVILTNKDGSEPTAEQIRRSVHSILRQNQREQQPRRVQDMDR